MLPKCLFIKSFVRVSLAVTWLVSTLTTIASTSWTAASAGWAAGLTGSGCWSSTAVELLGKNSIDEKSRFADISAWVGGGWGSN